MFTALKKRLGLLKQSSVEDLTEPHREQGKRIKEKRLEEICWELEMALLESDVAETVAEQIVNELRTDLSGKRIAKGFDLELAVENSLRESVR